MDKKQKTMFVSILVILLLIVLLVGFTFARYISTYNASGNLKIAKWRFGVTGWSTSEVQELTLLDTMNYTDLPEGKIAPGFLGMVQLELDATNSEVDVSYAIKATETGHKPENVVFQAVINRDQYTKLYPSLKELAQNELSGVIAKDASNKVLPITIKCIWPFETGDNDEEVLEGDIVDTAVGTGKYEGKENLYDYKFSLKVVGTQARATAKN